MRHELKIWPQYFCRVADGSKTFEVRENDRGFQPGDTVVLFEYDPDTRSHIDEDPLGGQSECWEVKGFTGKSATFKIGYVFPLEGTNKVVFSLLKAEATHVPAERTRDAASVKDDWLESEFEKANYELQSAIDALTGAPLWRKLIPWEWDKLMKRAENAERKASFLQSEILARERYALSQSRRRRFQ